MSDQTPKDSRLVRGKPSWDELDAMYAKAVELIATLTAERDKQDAAFSTLAELAATAAKDRDKAESRCQHLEQAVKDVRTMVERWRKRVDSFSQAAHPQIRDAAGWVSGCANEIDEALSALLSSQG